MGCLWTFVAFCGTIALGNELQEAGAPVRLSLNRVARQTPRKEVDAAGLHEKTLGLVLAKKELAAASAPLGGAEGQLEGAAYADYSVQVTIGAQTFEVIVDTGSSMFAVAASSDVACSPYYRGACTGPSLNEEYGTGSWTGAVCQGPQVTLAGLTAGQAAFGGIQAQDQFLTTCDAVGTGISSQGVLGMAYPGLLTDSNGAPLFDTVSHLTGTPNIFSMQCCSWNGGTTAGTGALVLGGVDTALFKGGTANIMWTPITEQLYFCISMTEVAASFSSAPAPTAPSTGQSTTQAPSVSSSSLRTTATAWSTAALSTTTMAQPTCPTSTGWTCSFVPCALWFISHSSCVNSRCVCQPGFCWDGYDCVSSGVTESLIEIEEDQGNLSASEPTTLVQLPSLAGSEELVSLASSEPCSTIVDSGTSALFLDQAKYRTVMGPIQEVAGKLGLNLHTDCIEPNQLSLFPNVLLTLGGNVQLTITPQRYFQMMPDSGASCLVFYIFQSQPTDVPQNLLGQVVMEEYYTVFDKVNARVGFAPIAGCPAS